MRAIVQVVDSSSVKVLDTNIFNEINNGLNILVGFTHEDTKEIVEALAKKVVNLRIFMDENNKMNLSVLDTKGSILSISQFTLYGDVKKGNRPGFSNAMYPDEATKMYEYFNECLSSYGVDVKAGVFGGDMIVAINNIGPTTIILDSDEIVKQKK